VEYRERESGGALREGETGGGAPDGGGRALQYAGAPCKTQGLYEAPDQAPIPSDTGGHAHGSCPPGEAGEGRGHIRGVHKEGS